MEISVGECIYLMNISILFSNSSVTILCSFLQCFVHACTFLKHVFSKVF